jgi:hypothetical protein
MNKPGGHVSASNQHAAPYSFGKRCCGARPRLNVMQNLKIIKVKNLL